MSQFQMKLLEEKKRKRDTVKRKQQKHKIHQDSFHDPIKLQSVLNRVLENDEITGASIR